MVKRNYLVALTALCCAVPFMSSGQETTEAEQTVSLNAGWNAVFLSVQTERPKVGQVFSTLPVDIVATRFAPVGKGQFGENPTAAFQVGGQWRTWYAPTREESAVANLSTVWGHRAYLIHSTADCTWTVKGHAGVSEVRWHPNAFNLVGFSVAPDAPPTFAEFFGSSKAHRDMIFYRLVDGQWLRVSAPQQTTMRAGEAFWAYCRGSSTFQGPVTCSPPGGIELGETAGDAVIEFSNHTDAPVKLALTDVTGSQPLRFLRALPGDVEADLRYEAVKAGMNFGIIEPGSTLDLQFSAVNQEMTVERETRVLTITSGTGQKFHLPVALRR